jgi:two-component SAPR family response regulator
VLVDNKLNIYIVEDNLLIAASLKHMLLSLGHSVCGTSVNYNKAVTELPTLKVDLVITDIILEGKKTGVDLGLFIKKHLHIPFFYQSSIASADMINAAMESLPDAYLPKPVSKEILSKAINDFSARQNK